MDLFKKTGRTGGREWRGGGGGGGAASGGDGEKSSNKERNAGSGEYCIRRPRPPRCA